MRILRWVMLAAVALCGANASRAQDLETTTEFGITVTPDHITDAIQETQDFWSPVLKFIDSEEFPSDAVSRKQAAKFFNKVHDTLYKRLFEGDEDTAKDLLDYLCLRLRKIILYRQIRETMNNDAALVALIERWERTHRDINLLPAQQRQERVKAILVLLPEEMAALGLPANVSAKALKLWELQSQCMARMMATQTGTVIAGFERDARQLDRPMGELLRDIAAAADWSLITKTGTKSVSRAEFEQSWKQIAELRQTRLTSATPEAVGR